MSTPVILVCYDAETREVLGIGLYEDQLAAGLEATRARLSNPHKLFAMFTPGMNDWVVGEACWAPERGPTPSEDSEESAGRHRDRVGA